MWKWYGICSESVALERFAVHSDVMSSSGIDGGYFWCLRHHRVETSSDDWCPGKERLGPYATEDQAQQALKTVADRNAVWDAEDAEW